jgi:preprotein translocase subunit SecG
METAVIILIAVIIVIAILIKQNKNTKEEVIGVSEQN